MSVPTSTKTITRLGVLTVLLGGYPVAGEHLEGHARDVAIEELKGILSGDTHVPVWKVRERSLERCLIGGRSVGYQVNDEVFVVTGVN